MTIANSGGGQLFLKKILTFRIHSDMRQRCCVVADINPVFPIRARPVAAHRRAAYRENIAAYQHVQIHQFAVFPFRAAASVPDK